MDERTRPQDDGAVPQEQQSVLMLLSNEMVRIYRDLFGRGPDRARCGWADGNTLVCTLEDSLTPAEQNLAKLGEHQRLRDVRMFFQHASEREFTEAVERATGRKVRAFVSGIDTRNDVSSEVFYMERDS